jgi:hypothetical protein
MSTLLLLKLTIAPGLVWLGTLVGRRWGPRAGGFVARFANSAGPILFLIAIDSQEAKELAANIGNLPAQAHLARKLLSGNRIRG